jgi:hypothetical protein
MELTDEERIALIRELAKKAAKGIAANGDIGAAAELLMGTEKSLRKAENERGKK